MSASSSLSSFFALAIFSSSPIHHSRDTWYLLSSGPRDLVRVSLLTLCDESQSAQHTFFDPLISFFSFLVVSSIPTRSYGTASLPSRLLVLVLSPLSRFAVMVVHPLSVDPTLVSDRRKLIQKMNSLFHLVQLRSLLVSVRCLMMSSYFSSGKK